MPAQFCFTCTFTALQEPGGAVSIVCKKHILGSLQLLPAQHWQAVNAIENVCLYSGSAACEELPRDLLTLPFSPVGTSPALGASFWPCSPANLPGDAHPATASKRTQRCLSQKHTAIICTMKAVPAAQATCRTGQSHCAFLIGHDVRCSATLIPAAGE